MIYKLFVNVFKAGWQTTCIVVLYIYIRAKHNIRSPVTVRLTVLRHTYCLKRVGKEGSLLKEKAGIRKAKILTIRELEEHAN